MKAAYQRYLAARVEVYGQEKAAQRPQTLMDVATIGAKILKKRGLLPELDESEEINACSIHVTATGGREGAGLAAHVQERDPQPPHRDRALRRRGHLHRRLHPGPPVRPGLCPPGHARHRLRRPPRAPLSRPWRASCPSGSWPPTAAAGYSSYGNQIGLATGHVAEVYHEGYIAKRLECGAVVGAAPACECASGSAPPPGTW